MNELQVFNSKEFGDIRTTEIDGKPYFVANDVARALGYKRPADAVTAHCKGSVKHRYLTDGGEQELKVIPEGDIYRLTVRSKLPSAEKFEKWVFDEVIPSIHQYGAYMTEQTIEKALTSPDFLIQLATKLKDEQTRRKEAKAEIRVKDQIIGELKPKADYYDEILKNPGLVTITQIAKDYGMSGKKMNRILHELGIQYKQSEQWLLYSDYHCLGYTQSEVTDIIRSDGTPDVKLLTKWTMKGRLFLYNKLKEKGIIPVIEQGNSFKAPWCYILLYVIIFIYKFKGGHVMTEQEMQAKIEKDLEEFEQEQWRKFEEEDLAEKYEKFTEKFADNPDIDQQEIDDQWKEEKEELEADFKDDLKDLLKEEEERLIEYYSDDLD